MSVQRLVAVAPALVEQLVLLGRDSEKTLELICKVVVVAEAELIGYFAYGQIGKTEHLCGIGNDRDTDILLNGHLIVGFKHASRIDWRDAEALCNIVCGEIGLRAVVDEKADFVGKGELQLIYDAENGYYNRTVLFLNGEKVAEKELTNTTATQLKMLRCFNLYTAATYRLDEWWIAKGQTVSEKTGRYYFAKPLTSITALGDSPADNEYLRALNFGNDVPVTDGVVDVSQASFTNGKRGFFDLVFKEQLRKQPIAETVTFSLKLNPYQTSLKTNNFLGFGCVKLAEKDNLIRINERKVGIATDTTAKSFTYSEAIPADAFTAIDVAFTHDGTKFVEMTLYVGGKSIGSLDISSLNFTSLYGFRFLKGLTGDCSFKDLKVRAGVYINDTTTALLGYQCTNVYERTENGTAKQVFDLRIVAEIPAEALADITKAGLLITMAVDGKTYSFTHEATVCYDSVIARDGHGEVKDVHAKEGTKLIALTLCGIPEGVRHSFRVQSFYERNGTSVSNIGSFDVSGAIR